MSVPIYRSDSRQNYSNSVPDIQVDLDRIAFSSPYPSEIFTGVKTVHTSALTQTEVTIKDSDYQDQETGPDLYKGGTNVGKGSRTLRDVYPEHSGRSRRPVGQ